MSEYFDDKTVLRHPASITEARAVEMDRDALMKVAVQRAMNAARFEAHPPYFFPAEISNNRIDAYFTRMRPSSLKNYAAEAASGVALMVAHATWREMPIGGSLTGEYTGPQGNGIARVRAEFYTIPGLEGGVVSSEQFILGVDTGVYKDVSIGFYGGRVICSIDGLDIFRDWRDCPHIPGYEYDVRGGDGETTKVLCIGDVEDAHLSEVSGVHDGATPGCAVLKAMLESEAGRMSPEMGRKIEQRYRSINLKLPGATSRFFPGHNPETEERGNTMPKPDGENKNGGAGTQSGQQSTGAGQQGDPPPPPPPATPPPGQGDNGERMVVVIGGASAETNSDFLRALLGEAGVPEKDGEQQLDATTRVRLLLRRAKDGETYRRDLIVAALKEGVRAFGAGFNQEAYKRTLEASDIDTVKLMHDDWARAAKAALAGGRATTDGEGKEGEERGGDGQRANDETEDDTAGVPAFVFRC